MNKWFKRIIITTVIFTSALFALTACAPSIPALPPINTQIPTAAPAIALDASSFLAFPFISADAGNFALQAGDLITFTWENAPSGADKYEFSLSPLNGDPSILIGTDLDASDGVAVSWMIPEHVAAELHVTAYFPDGRKLEPAASMIYSGDLPPSGVCSLIAHGQPVKVYRRPDRASEIFARLLPGVYAPVLEITPDDWYRIDASAAEVYAPSQGSGFHDVPIGLVKNPDLSPASGEGWVNNDKGILLTGSCPP